MGTFTIFFLTLEAHMELFHQTFLIFCGSLLPILLLATLLVGITFSFREGVITVVGQATLKY